MSKTIAQLNCLPCVRLYVSLFVSGVWTMCWMRLPSTEMPTSWWLPIMRTQWNTPWGGTGLNEIQTQDWFFCTALHLCKPSYLWKSLSLTFPLPLSPFLSHSEWMSWVSYPQRTRCTSVSYWACVIRSASRWVRKNAHKHTLSHSQQWLGTDLRKDDLTV